jgi:hypothetical protein
MRVRAQTVHLLCHWPPAASAQSVVVDYPAQLYKTLFTAYNKNTGPWRNTADNINVTFTIDLYGLISLVRRARDWIGSTRTHHMHRMTNRKHWSTYKL